MAKAKAITGLDVHASLAANARLIARTRLDELYQWDRWVDRPYSVGELHNMRIAAKRLRYTLEIFEDVLPAASKDNVEELTLLQDELGVLHDSDVLIAVLRQCLASQDGEVVPDTQGEPGKRKTLVPVEMVAHLLDPSSRPTSEQRYGLEELLQRQEHLRIQQYAAFRQHWYQLKASDLRQRILDTLSE